MEIKVLGLGCPKCKKMEANVRQALLESGLDVKVTKVEDVSEIMKLGVMTTPGLIINGNVVSQGKLLTVASIKKLLAQLPD